MTAKVDTSIFIVPRESTAWRGNEAGWITASGWASAGKMLWGEALVATRDGVFTPEESRLFPRVTHSQPPASSIVRRFVPEFMITASKDYRLWRSNPAVWPIEDPKLWKNKNVRFVWERHDLFAGPGRRLADRLGVPLVTSAEAVVVWEAKRWGVKRPIYGSWLEQREGASLKRSDLVLCVSEEVRQKVLSLGGDATRTLVVPNRVDSTLFHPGISGDPVRKRFNLEGKKVIGWTGSFRKFHGLPTVLSAFARVNKEHPDTVLMLVGDGQELETIRGLAGESGIADAVIFTGRQPFTSIPSFVAAFDIGLVTAAATQHFHYSPLKLREYLALGKAIIASRVGDLPDLFDDGENLLFYDAGDTNSLASAMIRILEDRQMKSKLESKAQQQFNEGGSWLHELMGICGRLGIPVRQPSQKMTDSPS